MENVKNVLIFSTTTLEGIAAFHLESGNAFSFKCVSTTKVNSMMDVDKSLFKAGTKVTSNQPFTYFEFSENSSDTD